MDQDTIVYFAITSVVALLLIFSLSAYGPYVIVVVVLVVLAVLFNLIINYADFLIFPLITKTLGIKVIPASNYVIPKDENCVIKYTNGLYYATGYLTSNVYGYVFTAENIQGESEDERMANAADKWERIVMSINFPFKFNLIAMAEDVQNYRDELEGRRGYLEYQVSKEMQRSNPSQITLQDLQRKIKVIQARIDRVSLGERPINSIMYLETTAVGVSEKEAVDLLNNQLNNLQTVFNSLDLGISRIVGRELYFMYKFNYMLFDFSDMTKLFNIQK